MGFGLILKWVFNFCKGRFFRVEKDKTDRLSELPDCLIHSILNFLPIGDAARTSVLSKRFRYCWKGIQVLKFDESFNKSFIEGKENFLFMELAELVVARLDGPVLEFELHFPPSAMKTVANSEKRNKLSLPCQIYKIPYITKLYISNCTYSNAGSGYDNLVSLTLCSVTVDEKWLETVTCKSLKLECLVLRDVKFVGNNPIVVGAPKLKTLEYRSSQHSLRLSFLPLLLSATIDSVVEFIAEKIEGSYLEQFFTLLPKLEEVDLSYQTIQSLVDINVPANKKKVEIKAAADQMMISCSMPLIRTLLNMKKMKYSFEKGCLATVDKEARFRYKESDLIDEIEATYSRCLNAEQYSEVLKFIREITRTAVTIRKKRNGTSS